MAMDKEKIAVIGAGNMGGALISGMLSKPWARAGNFIISDIDKSKLKKLSKELKISVTDNNRKAVSGADIIILAVKPQIMDLVLEEINTALNKNQILISIAAGITISRIHSLVGKNMPIIRAMPNISALVAESATAICAGKYATKKDIKKAVEIMESIGTVVEVREMLMDAVTGLSGTGPMYIFLLVEGMSDAGVKVGLSRDVSNSLSVQTVLGAAKIMQETGWHPGRLKDLVTSPGGTAISALHSLERNGMKAMLIDAVETATKRSIELGKHPERED